MHVSKPRRPPLPWEQVSAQSTEPPYTDPYVRWCGRGGAVRFPPIPICRMAQRKSPKEATMPAQVLRKEAARNPRTIEEARALVAHVESLFMPWNLDALVDG